MINNNSRNAGAVRIKIVGVGGGGSNSVLLYFTASGDVLLDEIQEIAEAIQAEADPNANIIMGMNFDDTMNDAVKVVLFATRK